MKLPKISIVTPSYNQAEFLEQAIKSILSQNYPNIEYWVIDGNSTDNTLDILKKYDSKINWLSEKDLGQADAINKGLKRSTGDILAYLNSDDLYLPGSLEKVGQTFKKKSINWLTGDYEIINEKGDKLKSFIPTYKSFWLKHFSPFVLKSINSVIPQPSTFWSREAYEKIGEFKKNLNYSMDYDYWLRLSKNFKFHYLPETLSQFRVHKKSKSSLGHSIQFKEEFKVLKTNKANLIEKALHWFHTRIVTFIYSLIK